MVLEPLFVESFCGPGGMSLGLERAGFTPALSFDFNEKAVETHRLNLPGPCWANSQKSQRVTPGTACDPTYTKKF